MIALLLLLIYPQVALAANETNYTLSVYSNPTGNLSINGTNYGLTPAQLNLTPAIYLINVTASGYWPNATTINLSTNTTLNLTLSPINNTNTTNSTGNQTGNQTPQNITIESITPENGKIYSKDDTKPTAVDVILNGTLNLNASNITLVHNGENKSWIIFRTRPRGFYFQLDQTPDGVYSGHWTLVSTDNVTTVYDYEFSIITTQPPKAYNIGPPPDHYTTDRTTLEAEMNGTNYTMQWLVSDGYPSASSSKWKSMSQTGNRYSESIDFEEADVGAIYLKILDQAGNYRIQPTGIVSAPYFQIDFEKTKYDIFRDEIAEIEFLIIRKDPFRKLLRCQLENLVKDRGTSKQQVINTNGRATLTHDEDDIELKTEYDETLDIGTSRETTIELTYETPIVPVGKYEGVLECLIAK
jgi:hypothetical protein